MNNMAGRKRNSAEEIVRKLRRADELTAAGKTQEEIDTGTRRWAIALRPSTLPDAPTPTKLWTAARSTDINQNSALERCGPAIGDLPLRPGQQICVPARIVSFDVALRDPAAIAYKGHRLLNLHFSFAIFDSRDANRKPGFLVY
jgi:hypothetical protein